MKVGEVVPAKESSLVLTPSGARVQAGDKATAKFMRDGQDQSVVLQF